MIGRRAVIGLSLLSALVFCAFAAQSASAAKAVNTTMSTCVDVGAVKTGSFTDDHCDKRGETANEKFAHFSIPLNETTQISAEDTANSVLKSKIALTAVEITCVNLENNASESLAHNVETEGKHTLTGVVVTKFSFCVVNKPAKCTVKEAIVTQATFQGVEGLGASGNEMGVEFKGSGEEETLAEITFQGASCALKEKTFKLKGSVIATSGSGSQTAGHSGATSVFTPEGGMQNLKIGAEKAEFFATAAQEMLIGNPIAATTTT